MADTPIFNFRDLMVTIVRESDADCPNCTCDEDTCVDTTHCRTHTAKLTLEDLDFAEARIDQAAQRLELIREALEEEEE